MKSVLYSATTFQDGLGGHYRSLISIAGMARSRGIHVVILNFGENNKVFAGTDFSVINVTNLKSEALTLKEISDKIDIQLFDIVHCLDSISFYFLNKITRRIILTKCGGRTPKYFYPYSRYISLFSNEDRRYFESKRRFKTSKLNVISNRVESFSPSETKILELKKTLDIKDDDLVLLKISRVTDRYYQHLSEAIKFRAQMSEYMPDRVVKLVIIGAVHDLTIFEKLKEESEDPKVLYVTDDYYTGNAKELLPICDLYIGSGRSLMEASFLALPVVTHAKNGTMPILVGKDNYEKFAQTNFGGRAEDDSDDHSRIKDVVKIFTSKEELNAVKLFSSRMYNELFSVEVAFDKYIELYKEVYSANNNSSSLIERILTKLYARYQLHKEIVSKK